jgi:hypothetical protein
LKWFDEAKVKLGYPESILDDLNKARKKQIKSAVSLPSKGLLARRLRASLAISL